MDALLAVPLTLNISDPCSTVDPLGCCVGTIFQVAAACTGTPFNFSELTQAFAFCPSINLNTTCPGVGDPAVGCSSGNTGGVFIASPSFILSFALFVLVIMGYKKF